MEGVGTGLGQNVNYAGRRACHFGAIEICLDLELLDGINGGPYANGPDEALIVVHAVDHVVVSDRILAVQGKVLDQTSDHRSPYARAIRLQYRRLASDLDGLRSLAEGHLGIHAGAV